jgi:ferrous iron transport protein B
MRKIGLPGMAVVPLLSSHACAIPGIMSARIIENPTQRLITMMISPLTTCSARLPVYTLLIAVIIPDIKVFGFLGAPGLTLFGLYMFGILSAFAVAFISKKTFAPQSPSFLMMELPPYRVPKITNILRGAFLKGWVFIKKAGTIILVLSVIIWGLVTFPNAPIDADKPAIHYSYAAMVGKTFEPIFRPLGFDWKITTALIPSFGAREVLVAAMGTVYAVQGNDTEDEGFITQLSTILGNEYSFATLMSLLIWFVFSPQCIATFGVMRKETNSYKMPLIFGAYTLAMAYFFSFITFLIFS